MFPKACLKPHTDSPTSWNTWILILAIIIIIAVMVVLELHIRQLLNHSVSSEVTNMNSGVLPPPDKCMKPPITRSAEFLACSALKGH